MSGQILTLIAVYGANLLALAGVAGAGAVIRSYGRRHEAATRRRGASLID